MRFHPVVPALLLVVFLRAFIPVIAALTEVEALCPLESPCACIATPRRTTELRCDGERAKLSVWMFCSVRLASSSPNLAVLAEIAHALIREPLQDYLREMLISDHPPMFMESFRRSTHRVQSNVEILSGLQVWGFAILLTWHHDRRWKPHCIRSPALPTLLYRRRCRRRLFFPRTVRRGFGRHRLLRERGWSGSTVVGVDLPPLCGFYDARAVLDAVGVARRVRTLPAL